MIKRSITPLSKDRQPLRNHSNNTKPLRDIKNTLPSRQSLTRNPSNSKLIVQNYVNDHRTARNNPEASIDSYLRSQQVSRQSKICSSSITEEMRKIAVDWMLQISHHSRVKRQTIFMAVYMFDSMLCKQKDITIQNVQLVATACFFMACKYQEVYPQKISQILRYSLRAYSKNQLVAMEEKVLMLMQFKLTFATRFTFFGLLKQTSYSQLFPNQANVKQRYTKIHALALFLLEVSLLTLWQQVSESDIAEAVMFLACKIMKISGVNASQSVMETAYKLMGLWKQNEKGVIAFIYDNQHYSFVGGLKIHY